MLGAGTLGELTLAEIPRPAALRAAAVSFALTGLPVAFGVAILPSVAIYAAVAEPAGMHRTITGAVALSGEATVEFVGTTRFIDMIERGDAQLGIAVEIRLWSL